MKQTPMNLPDVATCVGVLDLAAPPLSGAIDESPRAQSPIAAANLKNRDDKIIKFLSDTDLKAARKAM